jgi:hypothetical protein
VKLLGPRGSLGRSHERTRTALEGARLERPALRDRAYSSENEPVAMVKYAPELSRA